jgi:hypothetical protein
MGKSTYDEMRAVPNAVEGAQDTSRYVTYQQLDFWVGKGTIFNMMYLISVDPLPR